MVKNPTIPVELSQRNIAILHVGDPSAMDHVDATRLLQAGDRIHARAFLKYTSTASLHFACEGWLSKNVVKILEANAGGPQRWPHGVVGSKIEANLLSAHPKPGDEASHAALVLVVLNKLNAVGGVRAKLCAGRQRILWGILRHETALFVDLSPVEHRPHS